MVLTEEQVYSIANFLRTAAERFDENAITLNKLGNEPLKKQFTLQASQARVYADWLEGASTVTLEDIKL